MEDEGAGGAEEAGEAREDEEVTYYLFIPFYLLTP